MKILAPLAKSDEVEPLIAAGAHEFYCGITPPGWADLFGATWVHRRNPRTGVADVADLERSIVLAGTRPVYVTLNAASYPAGAVPLLVRFGHTLVERLGVAALIVGDVELLLALVAEGLGAYIHVSSLASCRNAGAAAFYRDLGVARVILPRHVSLREIEQVATAGIPIEVFALNDGCAFEEGTCATTHAYGAFCIEDRLEGKLAPLSERYEFWKWTLDNCGSQTSRGYTLGPCGLCALPRLLRAGIASVKVVGREASCARKAASVRLASIALEQAQAHASPEAIRAAVIAERGAPELCADAHLCYYPDVWDGAGAAGSKAEGPRKRRVIRLHHVHGAATHAGQPEVAREARAEPQAGVGNAPC